MSPISSTNPRIRHHTIVVTQKDGFITGSMLEKDWYLSSWAELFDWHERIPRPQGIFHLVGQGQKLSVLSSVRIVDDALHGQVMTYDLTQFSVDAKFFNRNKRK